MLHLDLVEVPAVAGQRDMNPEELALSIHTSASASSPRCVGDTRVNASTHFASNMDASRSIVSAPEEPREPKSSAETVASVPAPNSPHRSRNVTRYSVGASTAAAAAAAASAPAPASPAAFAAAPAAFASSSTETDARMPCSSRVPCLPTQSPQWKTHSGPWPAKTPPPFRRTRSRRRRRRPAHVSVTAVMFGARLGAKHERVRGARSEVLVALLERGGPGLLHALAVDADRHLRVRARAHPRPGSHVHAV